MAYGEWAQIMKAVYQAEQESRERAERHYRDEQERRRFAEELTSSDRVSDRGLGSEILRDMDAERGIYWEDGND